LELEYLDRDLYRGTNELFWEPRPRLYGGQVAAQALKAAALTVEGDRRPHSLHSYFLRPGDPNRPVILKVDRDRDGRSFSARRVAAVQNGDVIFEMSCSFQVDEDGAEFAVEFPADATHPDDLGDDARHPLHMGVDLKIDLRVPGEPGDPERSLDRIWARFFCPVPDDPLDQACLLTFMSDLSSGFGDLRIDGIPKFGATIDHAMWFQRTVPVDQWLLFESHPVKVGSHRGLYDGEVFTADGTLVATFAQEMLLRP
jgi:acyl-CoA thioesterase II